MGESFYYFTEYDELVPVLLMLLQQSPEGARLKLIIGDAEMAVITKKENGFTISSDHASVHDSLERLNQITAAMRGVKILKPEFPKAQP